MDDTTYWIMSGLIALFAGSTGFFASMWRREKAAYRKSKIWWAKNYSGKTD